MTANPAFKYPNIVRGKRVKVVKSINLEAAHIGRVGKVIATYRIAHTPVEVLFEDGTSILFAEEELAVLP
jgi:hypothetical protein